MHKTIGALLLCALAVGAAALWLRPRGEDLGAPEVGPDRAPGLAFAADSQPTEASASRIATDDRQLLDDLTQERFAPGAPAAGGALRGVVTDANHRPVAGARVSLRFRQGMAVAATTTGQAGGYRMATVPASGRFELWVQPAGGWLPEARDLQLDALDDRTFDFELSRAATVRCEVRDAETQAPVAGAELRLDELPRPFARSGTDGCVDLQLPLDARRVLRVVAPGYAPIRHELEVATEDRQRPLRLLLARAARIHGRVVDLAGVPVAGAELGLWRVPLTRGRLADRERAARRALPSLAPGSTFLSEPLQPRVTSAADGRFEFARVFGADGVFHGRIQAACDGFCDTMSEPIDLDFPAREASVALILPRGGVIEGHLRYRGQPCVGEVRSRVQDQVQEERKETEADGGFCLGPFPSGVVELTASGGRRSPAHGTPRLTTSRPIAVNVTEGSHLQIDLDLELEPPPEQRRLAGTVRDAAGRPRDGVVIRCTREEGSETGSGLIAITQDDGCWDLQVPAASTWRVAAQSLDFARCYEHVRPPRQDLDFTAERTGRVQLDVARADGKRPSELRVFVRRTGGATWLPYRKELEGLGASIVLDPDDQLELPLGEVDLRFDELGCPTVDVLGVRVAASLTTVRAVVPRGSLVSLVPGGDVEAREHREICLVPSEMTRVPVPARILPVGLDWPDPPDETGPVRRLKPEDGVLRARGVAPARYRVLSTDGDLAFDPEFVDVGEADLVLRVRITLRR